jgi:hypothetical protein
VLALPVQAHEPTETPQPEPPPKIVEPTITAPLGSIENPDPGVTRVMQHVDGLSWEEQYPAAQNYLYETFIDPLAHLGSAGVTVDMRSDNERRQEQTERAHEDYAAAWQRGDHYFKR